MEGHGHILMNEANVDLNKIIDEENFYISKRDLSSNQNGYIGAGNRYGTSRPVRIPSKYEYDKVYSLFTFIFFSKILKLFESILYKAK